MRNLDFELGRAIGKIATDTGNTVEQVIDRLVELSGTSTGESTGASTSTRAISGRGRPRKSPVFVAGSTVHPRTSEIIRLRKQGVRPEEIISQTGIYRSAVYRALREAGLTHAPNQFTSKTGHIHDWATVKSMAKAGKTPREIANSTGMSISNVYRVAKSLGVDLVKQKSGESYWKQMTPEQRKAEMKRRYAVRLEKQRAALQAQ